MRIQEIKLENFRCFKELGIPFKTGINLLVGDNASGKTTILQACKYVLSSFFSGFDDDENTSWMKLSNDDYRKRYMEGIALPYLPMKVHFSFHQMNEYTGFYLKKIPGDKKGQIGIRSFREWAHNLSNDYISEQGQSRALPLLASFSTEDIHRSRRIKSQKFREYRQIPSFGYYECLDGDGFFKYWKNRILTLIERQKNLDEVEIVHETVLKVLGEHGCNIISSIETSVLKKSIFYIFSDGREIDDENLSDGYKRIINIVTDIAYRCVLLNRGKYGRLACVKTKGTVLIDEIDLHLHPSLQSSILPALQSTFQNIQFIVTAHAPMVMTAIESNEYNIVYHLHYNVSNAKYEFAEIQPFGQDSSHILSSQLGLIERNRETQQELDELDKLIDAEKTNEARALLEKLKRRYSNNLPEFASAETHLHLIDDLNALD